MKHIYTLLNELARCEINDTSSILYKDFPSVRSYNGITMEESENSYWITLQKLYSDSIPELVEMSTDIKRQLEIRIKEIEEIQSLFDVPPQETIDGLKNDYESTGNKSLKADYDFCVFISHCVKIQKETLENVKRYFNPNEPTSTNTSSSETDWITYKEFIQLFDFTGAKRVNVRMWRKKHHFETCIRQDGPNCAVMYSISKTKEWLENNLSTKNRQR